MKDIYHKKTFRIKPDTYKRIHLARLQTKNRYGKSWDVFFNELMDMAGIDKIDVN